MTPEEFREAGHRLVDWVADLRAGIAEHPVQAQTAPGEVRAAMPTAPPGPTSVDELIEQLDRVVVPGITHFQHPRFFGWFPANASLPAVLGDLVSTGIGALGISWQSAPALTEVEEAACDWMRQLVGLSPEWRGTIQDTASSAVLVALMVARERATGLGQYGGGLQAAPEPLCVYTSSEAHSSVQKAALLAGYGFDNLRLIDVHPGTRDIDVDALRAAVEGDVAAGRRPAAVVANVGSTGVTAFDPVAEVVEVGREHGMWVHVDAAMAGTAMLLPECRHLWEGVEGADSVSWNPHKWMGAAVDCSLFYVRDPEALQQVMATSPSYLASSHDGEVTQYRDWGIPLGRRFRSLKLWFVLALDGVEAVQERVRRDLANAAWLAEQVDAAPGWERVAPTRLQTVCVRHDPGGLDADALDRHTLAWVVEVNGSGAAFLTPAQIDGRWMVRVSIGAEPTTRDDVAAAWEAMQAAARSAAAHP